MAPLNGTKYRAIVDTHRHPVGAKLLGRRLQVPEGVIFTVGYSVRSAMIAVYHTSTSILTTSHPSTMGLPAPKSPGPPGEPRSPEPQGARP
jgi:hypothetical protein